MKALSELYLIADQQNIEVDCFDLHKREALSIMDEEGNCYIAIDPYKLRSEEDERLKLSHELGHCLTGSFYNIYAAVDHRRRHENRADKWAVESLIPVKDLDEAVAAGYTELWELADYFGVTEDFIKKAVCHYVHGNMATELYF